MFLISTSDRFCLSMASVLACCTSSAQRWRPAARTSEAASISILLASVTTSSCSSTLLPMNLSAPSLDTHHVEWFILLAEVTL